MKKDLKMKQSWIFNSRKKRKGKRRLKLKIITLILTMVDVIRKEVMAG